MEIPTSSHNCGGDVDHNCYHDHGGSPLFCTAYTGFGSYHLTGNDNTLPCHHPIVY